MTLGESLSATMILRHFRLPVATSFRFPGNLQGPSVWKLSLTLFLALISAPSGHRTALQFIGHRLVRAVLSWLHGLTYLPDHSENSSGRNHA